MSARLLICIAPLQVLLRPTRTLSLFLCLIVADPGSAADDDLIVRATAQDTLTSIVQRELRSLRFLEAIAEYNQIDDVAASLREGAEIRLPQPYLPLRNFGLISFCKGDVSHLQGDLLVNPPMAGAYVYSGDFFKTGASGYCSIQFGSGARTSIQPNSEVVVKLIDCAGEGELCSIGLEAERGEIRSEIVPAPGGVLPVNYTVDTPFMSATVRGTAFYTKVGGDESRLGVTRGEVGAEVADEDFDLPAGQGLLAAADSPPQQVDLLPAPGFANVTENSLLSREDTFYWDLLDGANAYQVVVARDEALTRSFSEQRTILPRWAPQADPGEYYVAIAGFDDNDFAGLAATRKIRFAGVDQLDAPDLNVIKSGDLLQITLLEALGGPLQISLSNSLQANAEFEHRQFELDNGDTLEIELDSSLDWAMRARTVLGEFSVSAYTDSFFFAAQ